MPRLCRFRAKTKGKVERSSATCARAFTCRWQASSILKDSKSIVIRPTHEDLLLMLEAAQRQGRYRQAMHRAVNVHKLLIICVTESDTGRTTRLCA